MAVKYVPFITVKVPSYSRHEDAVSDLDIECKVERGQNDQVLIVPTDARPTKPYLVSFNMNDVQEALNARR